MKTLAKSDYETIYKICERAEKIGASQTSRMTLMMDLSNVAQRYDIDLNELLNSADYDFSHDIGGIQRHFNRSSLVMEDHFVPRCSAM